jgi:hypothetical protein
MIGLRVGAGEPIRSATVWVAPPGRPPEPGAPVPLAIQVVTYLEERGVRETVPMNGLTVTARTKDGAEAHWSGASNGDGVAEASLALPGLDPAAPLGIEVALAGEPTPLGIGIADLRLPPSEAWGRGARSEDRGAVRPSKREGGLALDVLVEEDRLVVGFETPVWLHVVAAGLDPTKVTLAVVPEPGLEVAGGSPHFGANCDGWTEMPAMAQAHVVGLDVAATAPDGRSGVWFGALPVAPGAFFIGMPRVVAAGKSETAVLVAPNPRRFAYAEIDDESGRVFAAALPVAVEAGDPTPRARLAIPPLASGLHWLVVSGEPRGAERLTGAAIAKPFLVGTEPGIDTNAACRVGPWLARRAAAGFPRRLAFDGIATRGAPNRARHRIGLFLGLVALLAAAVLEVLLLVSAAREARAAMLLAELDAGDGAGELEAERVTARTPGGSLAVGLLVAVLGFALLAALLVTKG